MKKLLNIEYISFLLFISIWLSINLDFKTLSFSTDNFKNLTLQIRTLLPIFLGIIFLIFKFKFFKFSSIKNLDLISKFFLATFIVQSISFFIYRSDFHNTYFLILSFLLILIINTHEFRKNIYIFFYISIFFLSIYLVMFLPSVINFYLNNDTIVFYNFNPNLSNNIFGLTPPRTSGISRVLFILLILINSIYFCYKKKYLLLLSGLILLLIYLCQSRSVLIFLSLYLLIISFIDFFNKKFKINYEIICMILVSTFILITINKIKYNHIISKNVDRPHYIKRLQQQHVYKRDLSEIKKIVQSNGRVEIWAKIFKENKNFLIGNGVMGDRFLINESAHNSLVYNYASGGIICAILYLAIVFILVIQLIRQYLFCKNNTLNKKDMILYNVNLITIFFFIFRSIVETSYSVFSIDLILFFISYKFLNFRTSQ